MIASERDDGGIEKENNRSCRPSSRAGDAMEKYEEIPLPMSTNGLAENGISGPLNQCRTYVATISLYRKCTVFLCKIVPRSSCFFRSRSVDDMTFLTELQ